MRQDFSSAREAQTSIACKTCGEALLARRTCREAHLFCESCRKRSEVGEYIAQMDTTLENFLEALQCDRI